jgi:hypothetical protein
MKGLLVSAALIALALSAPVTSGERLSIRVSPALAFEPALLTIRTIIEPTDEARRLSVEVDSASFSTVSEIPLEGKSSPRVNVIRLKNVPSGVYEVRAVLMGPTGAIANTMQVVRIRSAAGDIP